MLCPMTCAIRILQSRRIRRPRAMTAKSNDNPTWRRLIKRCDECGGRFGLIVYRYFARRFCRKRCKDFYLARLRQRAQAHENRWLAYLSGGTQAGA